MTRTQQIRARLELAATNTYSGHMSSLMTNALADLAALLAVCEAAEAWEEAHYMTQNTFDLRKTGSDLLAAVRAYREGGEKG